MALPDAKVKVGVAPTVIVWFTVAEVGNFAVIQKYPVAPLKIDWLKLENVCVPAPAPLIFLMEVAPEKLFDEL